MFTFLVKCFEDMEYWMEGKKIKDYFSPKFYKNFGAWSVILFA